MLRTAATRADVPGTGQTFEDVAFVLVPTATVETAERELAATNRRAADVQRRTFQLGVPAAVQAIGGCRRCWRRPIARCRYPDLSPSHNQT